MTPNTRDIVIARVMLYCLHKHDGYSYQTISKQMGYSDGVAHKLVSGGCGSVLLLKCVGDFFIRRGSAHSRLVISRCQGHSHLLGALLFVGVREPRFLQFIRLISEDAVSNSNGNMQSQHAKSSTISGHRTHDVAHDATAV